jgi:predicted enzyme related to lactoylglutathione lyase
MKAYLRCEIFPSDLDATARFYTEVLGFRIARDDRREGIPYLALERGTVQLGAAYRPKPAEPDSRRPPIGVELVLEVEDLHAERDRVAAAGWPVAEEITDRPWGLQDFRVLDPDGYYWRLTTRAKGG